VRADRAPHLGRAAEGRALPLPRLPEDPRCPFSAFAIFSRAAVVLSGPEQGPLPHATLGTFQDRPGYRRAFCTRCGAHVFGIIERSDEIELPVGCFDETNVFTPTYESWTIRRERWLADLPTVTRHFERDRADGPTT
jgi:hypothetical protein